MLMSCFLTGGGEAAAYDRAAALRLEAIESVLWDAESGAWFDYSLVTHSRHLDFYASNLAPLWAQCYSQPAMGEKAVQYLKVGGEIRTFKPTREILPFVDGARKAWSVAAIGGGGEAPPLSSSLQTLPLWASRGQRRAALLSLTLPLTLWWLRGAALCSTPVESPRR